MKLIAALFAIAFSLAGCTAPTVSPKLAIDTILLAFYDLPCDDGYVASLDIPLLLTRQQNMGLLLRGLRQLEDEDNDLARKVVILVYMTPKEAVSLTIDFKQSVLEVRTDDLIGNTYRTDIWVTDVPLALLRQMAGGQAIPPTQHLGGALSDEPALRTLTALRGQTYDG